MGTNLLKLFFFRLAIEDILLLSQTTLLVNAKDACMTNAYHFNRGRDTVKNHALRGHVISNVESLYSALRPTDWNVGVSLSTSNKAQTSITAN